MKTRNIMTLAIALVLGFTAVMLTRSWIASQIATPPARQEAPRQRMVVAAVPLNFGSRIGPEHLREVDWPTALVPQGAFPSIEELLKDQNRVVLQPIATHEPILASKVTGPGQRASLSSLIDPDMRAMSIRVNDVLGVAGFVLPNDRVDLMLTREVSKDNFVTDVLLQNVKVLAIDQIADGLRDSPVVVKAVTLEVNTEQAQKLTLAARVGVMSLALRAASDVVQQSVRRVGERDLIGGDAVAPTVVAPVPAPAAPQHAPRKTASPAPRTDGGTTVIGVTRATTRNEYRIKPEGFRPPVWEPAPRQPAQGNQPEPLMPPVRSAPVPKVKAAPLGASVQDNRPSG